MQWRSPSRGSGKERDVVGQEEGECEWPGREVEVAR